jgi:osmotically-inducible protein OsmY
VKGGVAFVRGSADGVEDIDNAADVAARVPGVRRVVTDIETPEA